MNSILIPLVYKPLGRGHGRGRWLGGQWFPEYVKCPGTPIYYTTQISWIKLKNGKFCKLKTSLSKNFVFNLQTFRGFFVRCILRFRYKFNMKIIFYLPVNTDKPKFLAFLAFVCTIASFIAQISSSECVSKRDFIMAPVAKQ